MRNQLTLLIGIVAFATPAYAQKTQANGDYRREDIEQTEVGWMSPLNFTWPAKPNVQNGWNYSAAQMGETQNIATWMQQTFNPKGLLGEMQRSILATPASTLMNSNSYDYNEAEKNNRSALPNTYGAVAKLYFLLKKTDKKQFWPQSNLNFQWQVMANNVEMISKQVVALSSPADFIFILPKYEIGMKGDFDKEWLQLDANYRNFTGSTNLKRYEHYLVPPKMLDWAPIRSMWLL